MSNCLWLDRFPVKRVKYSRSKRLDSMTITPSLSFTAFFNALGLAFFHGAEYMETQIINDNTNAVPYPSFFRQTQPNVGSFSCLGLIILPGLDCMS